MTVSDDLAESKGTEGNLGQLLGKEGKTISALRPAGFAFIGDRRVDVVTQGEMIETGASVHVVRIESNRVIVERTRASESGSAA